MIKLFSESFYLLRGSSSICNIRYISTSLINKGMEEFFPPGVYNDGKYVDENPVIGRRWKSSELRIRSNSDLHKFWYVLLKERNMLLTMRQECKRLGIPVPAPTRYHKVRLTMTLIKRIIDERNSAILNLTNQKHYEFDETYANQSYDKKKANENNFEDNEDTADERTTVDERTKQATT